MAAMISLGNKISNSLKMSLEKRLVISIIRRFFYLAVICFMPNIFLNNYLFACGCEEHVKNYKQKMMFGDNPIPETLCRSCHCEGIDPGFKYIEYLGKINCKNTN